ncbi:RidA family protein [Rubrobacter calidifluminis]|uniref:RidA family protein n=1 Tax=Rubrobacter calidifluminis TaxID=1392640 RepID=UPI00235F53CD|nr:RidA family protein [Rubrobacter calidifluminis]
MHTTPQERLKKLGYELPAVPAPAGSYVPAVRSGNLIFTAGQLPLQEGRLHTRGRVGEEVSIEEAREAARICALNALAAAAEQASGLDKISRIVRVGGFVASAPGFERQPEVLNGASELLGTIFGEAGTHARTAVGVCALPFGSPVEVELVVEVSG